MQRILIDTDPGVDDAFAIFLAMRSPEVTRRSNNDRLRECLGYTGNTKSVNNLRRA